MVQPIAGGRGDRSRGRRPDSRHERRLTMSDRERFEKFQTEYYDLGNHGDGLPRMDYEEWVWIRDRMVGTLYALEPVEGLLHKFDTYHSKCGRTLTRVE
jgi:hypothetical protein